MSDPIAFGATVDGLTLKQALARIKPAVSRHGASLPILRGVHVDITEPGQVTLTATDLDLTMRTTIPADRTQLGSTVIPFARIEKAVASYKAKVTEPVPLELTGDDATLTVDGSRLTLRCESVDEWPRLQEITDGTEISFDIDAFCSVQPFAGTDDTRPILQGILLDTDGCYAATDSYRLATCVTGEERDVKVLVPAKIAPILAKNGSGRTTAIVGNREIRFDLPDVTIWQRVIEGEFPNYRGLIPGDTPARLDCEASTVHDAMVKILKHKATVGIDVQPVRITNAGPGRVSIALHAQDVGSVEREINARLVGRGGVDLDTVGFNPEYLASILDGAQGRLEGTDHLKPWVLRWVSDLGANTRLIMPVRIS